MDLTELEKRFMAEAECTSRLLLLLFQLKLVSETTCDDALMTYIEIGNERWETIQDATRRIPVVVR